jgi:hypothetical protein
MHLIKAMNSAGTAPFINLDTRLDVGVNFKPPPLLHALPTTKEPKRQKAGWTERVAGAFTRAKKVLPLPEIEPRFLGRPPRSLVTTATELSRLTFDV